MTHTTNHALTVLITDDIAQNRSYFADILREITSDITIHEAENGKDAVDQVARHIQDTGKSFDLIIMDFRMPVLNGAEATAAIREVEAALAPSLHSIIITWSTSMQSPYPKADDWLPKMTSTNKVKAMLTQFELLQGG